MAATERMRGTEKTIALPTGDTIVAPAGFHYYSNAKGTTVAAGGSTEQSVASLSQALGDFSVKLQK